MRAPAIITVTAAVFSDYFTEGLSAFRNGFLCPTHSSRATPELNKPPPPRSPPGAGRLETRRLGLGRCSATRVPHSRAPAAAAQQALGREGVEDALLAAPRTEPRGKAPARVPSKPRRAAPPAGCVGAARRPQPEKPTGPTAHDARGAQAQRPRGVTARRVGSQRPGERPRRDAEAASGEFLLLHVVPQGLAQVLLRRLQLAHKGRHCSPRTSPTSHLSAAATSNRKNNSTKAWAAATPPAAVCPAPRSSEDLCSVFSSARLAEGQALSRTRRFRGPAAPAPRVACPASSRSAVPPPPGCSAACRAGASWALSLSAARVSNSLFLPA